MFPVNSVGIVTARDSFTIHETPDQVKKTINTFLDMKDEEAREYFKLGKDAQDWKVSSARKDLEESRVDFDKCTVPINYRPFDKRYTYYTGRSNGFHCRARDEVMSHFLPRAGNVGLISARKQSSMESWNSIFIANEVSEGHFRVDINYFFPLYLYGEQSNQGDLYEKVNGTRQPNVNKDQISLVEKSLNLKLATESNRKGKKNFSPLDILDYIYAILHSPAYRKKYEEFLKIDFPRIPYPKDQKTFWQLVKFGSKLREVHLLENPVVENFITKYPVSGDNLVEKVHYKAKNDKKRQSSY